MALYKELFPDLRFVVDDQVTEGDHASSDTMELVRQLGIWRLLLLAVKHPRLVFRRS